MGVINCGSVCCLLFYVNIILKNSFFGPTEWKKGGRWVAHTHSLDVGTLGLGSEGRRGGGDGVRGGKDGSKSPTPASSLYATFAG